MKKEEFIALGLSEELAEQAAAASKKELEGFIPKTRFNEVNDANKELTEQITERDKQLVELGKTAGGNEELKQKITDLEKVNADVKADYESKLNGIKISTALKEKLTGTKYTDLLIGKIDYNSITIKEDGSISGADEQVKTLRETYKELFEPDKPTKPNYNPQGGTAHKEGIGAQIAEQKNEADKSSPANLWGAE